MSKPIVWLKGEIKTPPFSLEARLEAGYLLRQLQEGELLSLPHSRPMSGIGAGCHELRVRDANKNWRIMYRVEPDAIVILEVFEKKTQQTPKPVIDRCKDRLSHFEAAKATSKKIEKKGR
ncbi:MAG TPA: type II toxin-antitoxin system RelE/ParE family toxin [Gemmataceae bacterium]|jgi:phage-related protein|nr:type II toxin-antitoxin system RelE/ParE family toxin [Gemmataceae bacterium]